MRSSPFQPNGGSQLSRDAAQLLVQHVAFAAARDVPLPDVLEALAEDMGDRRLATAAHGLAERIRSGAPLEQALTESGRSFPPQVQGILLAGARAGDLPLVLEGYAGLDRQRRHVHGIVRSALAYPILIAVLLIPVLLILSLYVAPVFEELFRDFDLDLPEATLMAFRTARFAPFALGSLLVVPAATAALLSVLGGHWLMHRLRGATPVFGPLWTWAGQSEFALLLRLLVAARLPLDQAVEATSQALSDRNLARACPHLVQAVTRGVPLGEALDRSMHFDRTLAPLVTWGEQNGLLEDALAIASSVLRERLEGYAAMLRRVIPVVSLAIIAAFIAGIAVVGFLLPLLELLSALTPGGGGGLPGFFGIW
jgi:type IV pilus assembly protein PilC